VQTQTYSQASSALSSAMNTVGNALTFGAKQNADTLGGLQTAYADAKGRGAMTDKILMLAIAGALFVAFQASRRAA
jgi:hypothetical protein